MEMVQCGGCHQHVFAQSERCPHCGAGIAGVGNEIRPSIGALLLGLMVGGCDDALDDDGSVALYGVAMTDDDEDGWSSDVDCDDSDPDIHPEAEETPGDGVDSNCDGEDDT